MRAYWDFITLIIANIGIVANIRTLYSDHQTAIEAQPMNEQLVLYVMDGCGACVKQKSELNPKFQNVVTCTPDNCVVLHVPTWYNIKNKKIHVGYLSKDGIRAMLD